MVTATELVTAYPIIARNLLNGQVREFVQRSVLGIRYPNTCLGAGQIDA
jgi:hypothetical protein